MRDARQALLLTGAAALLGTGLFATHDGEWPPLADPQWDADIDQVINNPDPPGTPGGFNTHLYLDRVELAIPNTPLPYADWITHWHGGGGCGFGGWQADFAIGDVDNDGLADDIVMTQPGEAVFAAELTIDPVAGTGTLTPHWLWLSPYAQTVLGGSPSGHAGNYSCGGNDRNNPLIWDVDGDGQNEVVFVGLDATDQERLYVLRHQGAGSVAQLAESPPGVQVQHRLGIARVTNTPEPRDIVCTSHGQGYAFVWSFEGGSLVHKYSGDPFTNPGILAKQHAGNWGDVDGDGFDEFCLNGIVDFVDADVNGDPVVLNGANGVARWQIMDALNPGDGNGAHCDKVLLADWDPTRDGLEVYAVTETGSGGIWKQADCSTNPVYCPTNLDHDKPLDTLWDADCGTLLSEWTGAPAHDGQTMYAANWTKSHEGIELICSPKDLNNLGLVIPPGQNLMDGSYVVATRVTPGFTDDLDFQLLTIDGSLYDGPTWYERENGANPDTTNNLHIRSGGPWRRMWAVDWDGDYATDEILHHPLNTGNLILFRLGEKSELVVGAYPPGVPTQAQVQNPVPPIQEPGMSPSCSGGPQGWWYFYSQGECGEHIPPAVDDWSFQNGGPGRGTHYFEKLKEVWPGDGEFGAIAVHAFDLEGSGDHREEVLAISFQPQPTLHVYFNGAPLAADVLPRPSPHGSLEYRRYRQTQVIHPFSFQESAVAVARFGVRPTNGALPERVVGMDFGGSVQLEAFVEFSDGSELDVTGQVTWVQDAESAGFLAIDATGTVTAPGAARASGRFQAEMMLEGELQRSEPTYVWSGDTQDPAILRAGILDTWLVDEGAFPAIDDRPLKIEALVAQRDNATNVRVFVLNPDGTLWRPNGQTVRLRDNGLNGDERAGDGIYTAVLDDAQGSLALGENLLVLRALLPPIAFPLPPLPQSPHGVGNSDPWPYFPIGAVGGPPWPNPTPPTPIFTEVRQYEAPRIRSMGYRGFDVPDLFVFEVEVERSELHPGAPITCFANIPGVGYVPMADAGDGLFTLTQSVAGAPAGLVRDPRHRDGERRAPVHQRPRAAGDRARLPGLGHRRAGGLAGLV